MKSAIVIGATSGIGRALATLLASNGYVVGLAGRRVHLLTELQEGLGTACHIKAIDVSKPSEAIRLLQELIAEMKKVDLFVISAGTGFINPDLNWEWERETIDVNVSGFAAMANVASEHLQANGTGQLVGISSLAAVRGGGGSPAYNASKAFVSNYLEGLRHRFVKHNLPVVVTNVQPGFIDTAMAKGEGLFWVASPEKAAMQIFNAIQKRKSHIYVTRRWRLIAWLLKAMPDWLYYKL